MPSINGAELRISHDSCQGGRKYMEDVVHIHFEEKDNKFEFAFFAVYDGHGGPNASQFAKEHLLNEITKQKNFWSTNDNLVLKAIKDGFISCHRLMWKAVGTWPKTVSGLPSTSGTTASVVFIRRGKVYCAHVGDSGVVLGVKPRKANGAIAAHCMTVDHKPESPKEYKRIKACGGDVVTKAGVNRVVWDRPKLSHNGPLLRSTEVDHIPFLAVARALGEFPSNMKQVDVNRSKTQGDLWSYNSNQDVFVVSPEPDVCVFDLDVTRHRALVLASDGLWNMVRPQECIDIVLSVDENNEKLENGEMSIRPANAMVRCALERWGARNLRADNTSVVVVLIDATPEEQRKRSGSSASTVSICSSRAGADSDSEPSESELSDSELCDNFADLEEDLEEVMEVQGEEGKETCENGGAATPLLPCFGGVGLERTPPCRLLNGEMKPRLRRIASCKKINSRRRSPFARGNVSLPGSAPAGCAMNTTNGQFRGFCKNSPFTRLVTRVPGQSSVVNGNSSTNASFMDPGFKSPVPLTHINGASPLLPAGERTLRPKSPRLIGENLLISGSTASGASGASAAECTPAAPAQREGASDAAINSAADKGTNSTVAGLNFAEPKEATSPISPMKIDSIKGSPAAGLLSPIWPSNLEVGNEVDIAFNGENILPSSSTVDSESTENIEHPKNTPRKTVSSHHHKRKLSSQLGPRLAAKRPRTSAQKSPIIRTRGQLKSLSPHKNSSPRKNTTPRKGHSS